MLQASHHEKYNPRAPVNTHHRIINMRKKSSEGHQTRELCCTHAVQPSADTQEKRSKKRCRAQCRTVPHDRLQPCMEDRSALHHALTPYSKHITSPHAPATRCAHHRRDTVECSMHSAADSKRTPRGCSAQGWRCTDSAACYVNG